jgi:Lon protease-like protein
MRDAGLVNDLHVTVSVAGPDDALYMIVTSGDTTFRVRALREENLIPRALRVAEALKLNDQEDQKEEEAERTERRNKAMYGTT